jgi:CBS domain-containing protein
MAHLGEGGTIFAFPRVHAAMLLVKDDAMDLTAGEVMRRSITSVPSTMLLPELERAFVELRVSGFPVVDGERLVGVVSRSDIVRQLNAEQEVASRISDFYLDAEGFHEVPLRTEAQVSERIGQRMQELTVADVMHGQLYAVGSEQTLRAVAETMVDNNIHRVLVTNQGRLLGLISTMDFAQLYAQGRLKPA